ncbi:MAG: Thiosulfate sulfurtransferase [Sporanaerobacter sp.]|jgi:molybdopterin synthase sulfurtransferase|uniref:rhodanese-like domain-containing protein n=1 Tax=Sporanaerobacter sp. TaxID=2010183 RepID=UPI003A0FEA6F
MNQKFKSLSLLVAVLILTMVFLSACSKQDTKSEVTEQTEEILETITTEKLKEKLNDDSWIIVDTRINDAYNGWKLDGVKRGGHIAGAVDFSANWLKVKVEDKEKILDEALKTKNITADKNIVLYDANGKDALEVKDYLSKKGYKSLYVYDVRQWAEDESLPMEQYKNYHMIVPASIVKDIVDGKKPETFEDATNIKIVEASWGEEKTSYANGHIPTSVHINTDTIEPPPEWMLASDAELTQFALDYGFTKDDTIIVTGEAPMASYRVAMVLRYMGVKDVRVLNGGLNAWKAAGYEVETVSNKPVPGTDFGAKIPANPDLIDTIQEVKIGLSKPDEFTLVDNRTWEEHIGESSGYSYHDKKGRIPGSVFGYAGIGDSNSLQYYRNIDDTMRNADEIQKLWESCGIDTNKHLSFMCGSGWRAAEILTYANVMGYDNVSVYSDGWIGWSNNPDNPIETGDPRK